MLKRVQREVRRSVQKRGWIGTSLFGANTMFRLLKRALLGNNARNRTSGDVSAFDATYGVDTDGIIRLGALDIESPNGIYGVQYQPLEALDLPGVLEPLDVDPASTTFIDLGCGKGRVILQAAQLPFARVIGVEFSRELHAIAESNLRRFPAELIRAGRVDVVRGDAADFEFPSGPLVLFLYNPFEQPVMRAVVANLTRSYLAQPRQLTVIYFTPHCLSTWLEAAYLEQVAGTGDPAILQSRP